MLDSNSMADQTAQHSHVRDEEEGADDRGTMPLVEAAALGASSPGAVVRVPTSTTLSQADQIALRYQHQASDTVLPLPCCQLCHCSLHAKLEHESPSLVPYPSLLLCWLLRNVFSVQRLPLHSVLPRCCRTCPHMHVVLQADARNQSSVSNVTAAGLMCLLAYTQLCEPPRTTRCPTFLNCCPIHTFCWHVQSTAVG